jgi:hypothetical protein
MKRFFLWLLFVGAVIVFIGVFWQAFSIVAYVRTGNEDWVDAHGAGSLPIHLGQLAIVIGALVAYWGNWRMVGGAIGFLVLSVVQLGMIGDTEEQGDWINGLHGLLALVILVAGLLYAQRSWRELRQTAAPGAADSA